MIIKNVLALTYISLAPIIASAAASSPQDSVELMFGCFFGSAISGLFSIKRSRKNNHGVVDGGIDVVIALLSGVAAGFFITKFLILYDEAPALLEVYPPLTAALFSLMGAQIIEIIVNGELISWLKEGGLKRSVVKFFGINVKHQEPPPAIFVNPEDRDKIEISETGTVSIIKPKEEDDV